MIGPQHRTLLRVARRSSRLGRGPAAARISLSLGAIDQTRLKGAVANADRRPRRRSQRHTATRRVKKHFLSVVGPGKVICGLPTVSCYMYMLENLVATDH